MVHRHLAILLIISVLAVGCGKAQDTPPAAQPVNAPPDAQTLLRWGRTLVDGEVHDRLHLARQLTRLGETALPLLEDVLDNRATYQSEQLPKAVGLEWFIVVCWTIGQIGGKQALRILQDHERFSECRHAATAAAERMANTGVLVVFSGNAFVQPSLTAARVPIRSGAKVRATGGPIVAKDARGVSMKFLPVETVDGMGLRAYIAVDPEFPAFY